ncbi:hypothetical protein Lal_00028551 [Lupinus albus]|nr:hypothetical protein Lal_00028551 [Lupinus albus]
MTQNHNSCENSEQQREQGDSSEVSNSDFDYDSDNSPTYDVIYSAYVELHEELRKLAKINIDRKMLSLVFRHITSDKRKFIELSPKKGYVTYGHNNQGKNTSQTIIDNIIYIESFEHNLLSISQLCDKCNKVIFDSKCCIIKNDIDGSMKFIGRRTNNINMVDLDDITSLLFKYV